MAVGFRHRAAVEALALTGSETVLEIGCGPGVATRLILERLTTGQLLALDRSEKMIAQLSAAAPETIAAGRLTVAAVALERAELPLGGFDRIVAINLDLNLRLKDRWPGMLKSVLRPGGYVVLAFEGPPGSAKGDSFLEKCRSLMSGEGFGVKTRTVTEAEVAVGLLTASLLPRID